MKFCTIGCGGHASTAHGPAQQLCAQRHPEVELSACCDLNPKLAEEYRAAFGFERAYTNIDDMLARENPDAVALVVPAPLTCGLAVPLLERGIALHLEKPPGLTLSEFNRLLAAAEKGGGLNQVAFNRRFAPAIVQTREWLDQYVPAKDVFHIRYDLIRYARTDRDFSITAVHGIDAVRHLARSPYREIHFTYRELPKVGESVAEISMHGHCVNGTEVSLTFQPMAGRLAERASIHALGQSIETDILGKQAGFDSEASHWLGGVRKGSWQATDRELVERNGVYGETEAFILAAQGRGPAAPQLKDCRQQVVLMEAIRNREAEVYFSEEERPVSAGGRRAEAVASVG